MARQLYAISQPEPGMESGEHHTELGADGRVDADQFDPACVCEGASFTGSSCSTNDNRMTDWDEWWLDLHSESCKASIHNVMTTRIKRAKEKGCDGVDPDNVDSVSELLRQEQVKLISVYQYGRASSRQHRARSSRLSPVPFTNGTQQRTADQLEKH